MRILLACVLVGMVMSGMTSLTERQRDGVAVGIMAALIVGSLVAAVAGHRNVARGLSALAMVFGAWRIAERLTTR